MNDIKTANTVDFNSDGVITEDEIKLYESKTREYNKIIKWVLFSMVIVTGLLFVPFIPDKRIEILSSLLEMYYMTNAAIIGSYFGFSSFLGAGKKNG